MTNTRSQPNIGEMGGIHPRELVFVVDDDRGMRETVIEILDLAGIPADGVASAASARERVRELDPMLIVVDQRLPDANGTDLARDFKEQDPDRPVLLLTGYATMENAIDAVGTVDDYLVKPIQPDQLVAAIRSNLEKYRLRYQNRQLVERLQFANTALEASVVERTQELTGLVAMSDVLGSSISLEDVISASLATVCRVSGASGAALYLNDDELPNTLRLRGRHGKEWSLPPSFPSDASEPSFWATEIEGRIESVHLKAGGLREGVILLRGPTSNSSSFLGAVGAQITVAIQNARRLGRERETVERLSELSQMESMFLASVSHELRTPLTAVIGFGQMLKANDHLLSSEERAEMLDYIVTQGQRLNDLVNDVLDATRLESSQFKVKHQPLVVSEVVNRSIEPFLGRGRHIDVDIEHGLPHAAGDADRLEQVIANLLQNAIKYSATTANVEVRCYEAPHDVCISVADRGIGIAEEFLPHIFESFSKARSGDTRREAGLGLGLYIAKGFIDAMNGDISVTSELGKGTTFTIRLPRYRDGDEAA